jgi:hypothetical protein
MNKVMRRFAAKVRCINGHWIWQGAPGGGTKHEYGMFRYEGRQQGAHIVSYKLFIGPVGPMDQIHHKCRIKLCVAPWCLERTGQLGNAFYERKPFCSKGHDTRITGRRPEGTCIVCHHDAMTRYRNPVVNDREYSVRRETHDRSSY